MGMFSSYKELKAQTKEIRRTAPPVKDRMAQMQTKMEAANRTMAMAADPGALVGRGQVLAARDTGARIQHQTMVELQLLVTLPGLPPRPATTQLLVSPVDLGRLVPGTMVAVRANPATPDAVSVDLAMPVV